MNAVETSLDPVFLIAAGLVGVLLVTGFVGTYFNIIRSRGPLERRFVARACLGLWAIIALLFVVVYWVPAPSKYFAAGVCFLIFPVYVYRVSTMRQLIKMVDKQNADDSGEASA